MKSHWLFIYDISHFILSTKDAKLYFYYHEKKKFSPRIDGMNIDLGKKKNGG